VAAHECGHAIQDAKGYQPLVLTRTISPICAVASKISLPLILFGFIISMTPLVQIGLITFAVAISIQLLTLPVEFDASRRAVETLAEYGMVNDRELDGIKAVLKAAALTYVAAAASSVLQLLRLFLLTKGNGRRRR
jgi:Zn-dependent membrane protease YugP